MSIERRKICLLYTSRCVYRQREGPHRRGHDRRDGEGGDHQAGHGAGRADVREYRHCAGVCGSRERLSAQAGDAGIDVDRTAQDAGLSRRRDRADAAGAGHEGRHRQGRGVAADDAERGDAAAVQEPRQSGDPPHHDRRGNLERHRRQYRLFRCGRRHRRHHHRCRSGAEAAQAVAADRGRGAGGKPGAVRRPAHTAQDTGHRSGLRARHPRSFGDRRDHQDQQRHRARDLAGAGAQRGHSRRHFVGRRDRRRHRDRQAARGCRQDHPCDRAVVRGALPVDRAVRRDLRTS